VVAAVEAFVEVAAAVGLVDVVWAELEHAPAAIHTTRKGINVLALAGFTDQEPTSRVPSVDGPFDGKPTL
jgi:hypothetical protein